MAARAPVKLQNRNSSKANHITPVREGEMWSKTRAAVHTLLL